MRFMVIVPADAQSETGVLPTADELKAMDAYNGRLKAAGVLVTGEGLHDSSKGAIVRFTDAKPIVVDGPFTEAKEMIAGFWILDVKSKAEAIEWASQAPFPPGSHLEIRQVHDIEDWPEELRNLQTVTLS